MATSYVKFMRGTTKAYEKLAQKDDDTLYFLSDNNGQEGALYLGTKLIAGPDIVGANKLKELKDVALTEGLNYDAILMYDSSMEMWRDYSFNALIFSAETEQVEGMAGFVPAPGKDEVDKFLRGDGTWAAVGSSNCQIFDNIKPTVEQKHQDAINNTTADFILNNGDIAIIQEFISEDRYQYTSYVYKDGKWCAMDGNYSADNVYFKSDFTFTENVGTVIIPESGSTIVEATGKNVTEFLSSLFRQRLDPQVTQPDLDIVVGNNKSYEVGSVVTPIYIGTYDPGSYSYDASTGVTAYDWSATSAAEGEVPVLDKDENGHDIPNKGSFASITVEDDTNYWIKVQATFTDGIVPHDNLGGDANAFQIKSFTDTKTSPTNITGYRKTFYGALTHKNDLTPEIIRNELTSSTKAYGANSTFTIAIPSNALRVVIAYPATVRNMIQVLDENDSDANIVSGFGEEPAIMEIPGANNHSAIEYKVYVMDFAHEYGTTNNFKVKI